MTEKTEKEETNSRQFGALKKQKTSYEYVDTTLPETANELTYTMVVEAQEALFHLQLSPRCREKMICLRNLESLISPALWNSQNKIKGHRSSADP